ncbi:hypothetical protein RhiirC2_770244 [Rhizophagus irregularis]|uniref:Uncharacterized protein n=1 Tax=Rhizophagus irregularis TaxID=588596 RepID=A0A2N1NX31_9GLOM|nr:hypothetical protein RhiirC2_770244 [Rhizophagus irregularis]
MNKVDNSVKLQTVGVIHSGTYVCCIQRSESMQVSDNEKKFSDVLMLLTAVLNFKAIAKKIAEAVQKKLKIKEVILPKHSRKLRLQVDYSDEG